VINWDRYARVFREEQKKRRIAEGDAKYERDKAHYDQLHEEKRQQRRGAPVKVANGNNLEVGRVMAECMQGRDGVIP